jgi:hypothetical protein
MILMLSRLYAIYVAADEIHEIGFGSALRDSYIVADDIYGLMCKMGSVSALCDLYRCRTFYDPMCKIVA